MNNFLTKWDVNENLLQSYRSISIASQSFLLAVGSLLDKDLFIFLVLLAGFSIYMIWGIWYEVVKFRHYAVDYYKYGLKLPKNKRDEFSKNFPIKDYFESQSVREQVKIELSIPTYWRATRKKIDRQIPIILTFIWVSLIFFKYFEYTGFMAKFHSCIGLF